MATATPCGQLHCQKDSYARSLTTRVVSCEPSAPPAPEPGKKKGKAPAAAATWDVTLEDTVFFPEGGGQPWDLGTLGPANVLRVANVGGRAVHVVDRALDVGAEVTCEVDWARRWDHMQQHSGQHLITALAIEMFGYPTESWNLGPEITTLDLAADNFKREEFEALERRCNEAIARGSAVEARWIEKDSDEVGKIRCRGLPEGLEGPLRVLEMHGIDTNLCCGTHVKNTADLRQIKLVKSEAFKEKGQGRAKLYFLAGDRVLATLGEAQERLSKLCGMLNAGPDTVVERCEAFVKAEAAAKKDIKGLTAEVVELLSEKLHREAAAGARVLSVHRERGDLNFLRDMATALDDTGVFLLGTIGGPGEGMFMLSGPEERVKDLGPKVAEILVGRGGGKGRYQGKVEHISKAPEALAMLKEAVQAFAPPER